MIHTLNMEPHLKTKRLGLKDSKPGSLSKFFRIVLLLFILVSDTKKLLNFARGQQAFAYSLDCCWDLEYFCILT